MAKVSNSPHLKTLLHRGGLSQHSLRDYFEVDDTAVREHLAGVQEQYPGHSLEEQYARAVYRAITHIGKGEFAPGKAQAESQKRTWERYLTPAMIIWALLILLFLGVLAAKAEPEPGNVVPDAVRMAHLYRVFALPQGGVQPVNIVLINGVQPSMTGSSVNVNCTAGCSSSPGFVDNSTFTVSTSTINTIGAYYTSGAAPSLSTGNAGRVRMDANSYLFVDCVTGCAGGATTPADAFANPTTAGVSMTFNAGYNGATWDLLRSGDKNNVTGITGVLNTGPIGRYNATQPTLTDTRYNLFQLSQRGELLVSPGVSGFPVTFSSAQHTIIDSGTLTAVTAITNALPAGSNVIGHVITDSGSTTGVTGNVTVVQPTAGNLNATVVGTGTFAVQNTGTESGPDAAGVAPTLNPLQIGGIDNSANCAGGPCVQRAVFSNSTLRGNEYGLVTRGESDSVIAALLQALLVAQNNVKLRGSLGLPLGSVGDALKVFALQTDPCAGQKQNIAISQTANTKYLTGVGHRTYICSILIVGSDAENVSIVEGTGTTCGTGTLAVIGGATAAAGPNMAANGGFTLGNGQGTVAGVNLPGNDICVFESGSGRVAGNMTVAFGQ